MAEQKQPTAKAVVQPSLKPQVQVAPAKPQEVPSKQWTFVKMRTPAETVRFVDGTTFKFPLLKDKQGGYQDGSQITTSDEALVNKLREAAKKGVWHIVEVPRK